MSKKGKYDSRGTRPGSRPPEATTATKSGGPPIWVWLLVGVVALGILVVGYIGIGVHSSTSSDVSPNATHVPKSGFSWKYQAYSIKTGKLSHLSRGSHVTVVMLMASWCLYCAYDDRYVWPTILHTKGLTLDIIDVSPYSGIGDPGPKSPAFSGHDNQGYSVGEAGMRTTMKSYVKKFDLTEPNVHVYVDPKGITYFNVQYFPTVLFLNQQGHLSERVNGALTTSSVKSVLNGILG